MYAFLDERSITSQKSSRNGARIGFIQLHHNASTDGRGVVRMMVSGSREVSANCEQLSDGTSIEVVEREYRAWTSGSPTYDAQAYTFEVENESVNGWTVSTAAHRKIAKAVAEIATAEGFPINRWTVYGHNEMVSRWGVSYATACPGGLNIDLIVSLALQYQAGGSTTKGSKDMILLLHPTTGDVWIANGVNPPRIIRDPATGKPISRTGAHKATFDEMGRVAGGVVQPGYWSDTQANKLASWNLAVAAYTPDPTSPLDPAVIKSAIATALAGVDFGDPQAIARAVKTLLQPDFAAVVAKIPTKLVA